MHLFPVIFLYALLTWTIVYSNERSTNLSSLRFVHSLFRHGDRTPASVFRTDVHNQELTWPGGFGELTKLGIEQQYRLGQFIKQRYAGFLSEEYNAEEIHIRSTGYNRTIMSAMANLAGMYPPMGDQIWNKNLSWQPVPVHNRPRESDPVLWMDRPCPTVDNLYNTRVYTSNAYLSIEKINSDFLNWLREKTGRDALRLNDLWDVYDPLFCELNHNDTHTWPDWVNDTVFEKVRDLYRLSLGFYYNLQEIQRLRGGLLYNEIAGRMMEKIRNSSKYISDLKYFAYSIHDTTQIALLENLGVFDGAIPTYDQLLLLELHEIDGKYYVEFYKKNSTESDYVYNISLNECGSPCLADKFYDLSAAKKPNDWYDECGISPGLPSKTSSELLGVLIALCLLFFILFLVTLMAYLRIKRSYGIRLD